MGKVLPGENQYVDLLDGGGRVCHTGEILLLPWKYRTAWARTAKESAASRLWVTSVTSGNCRRKIQ